TLFRSVSKATSTANISILSYTTLFRSGRSLECRHRQYPHLACLCVLHDGQQPVNANGNLAAQHVGNRLAGALVGNMDELDARGRSEEHTTELQSRSDLVCRLLLEKKAE